MDCVVVDIRIGTPGPQLLSDKRMLFQNNVLKLTLPEREINRLAHTHSFAFSYGQLDGDAAYIEEILESACSPFRAEGRGEERALLVDITESPSDLIREPTLLHLASKLVFLLKSGSFAHVVLLLPFNVLPAKDSLLVSRLGEIKSDAHGYDIQILVNDGSCQRFPSGKSNVVEDYGQLMETQESDPLEQLDRKMVRRLGRFRSSNHGNKTRIYSYFVDNCDEELYRLTQKWWQQKHIQCDVILYDTGNIPSMTEAVRAFAEQMRIPYFRIHDVISNPGLLDIAKTPKRCLLVLDVIETGNTLLQHTSVLAGQACLLCNDVLSVLSRGGGLEQRIGSFFVSSFKRVDQDPEFPIEIQDSLGLPYTSHSAEAFEELRAFDIWYMAHEAKWELEPDVPETGYAYKIIPKFPRIMEMFGDWISYKIDKALKRRGIPQDIFIIHPNETGAIAVSDKLRTRLDPRLLVVRVPREYILAAQKQCNAWSNVLASVNKRDDWFYLLSRVRFASGIITDVFNASGSTFETLHALLSHFGIPCAGYFPFIDRDDFHEKTDKYNVPRFSLYSWYGPRKQKIVKEAVNVIKTG